MNVPLGTLLAALALMLVVAALIAQPLLGPRRAAAAPESEPERLERERRRVIQAIREVDFDRRTGKLSPEDHARLRTSLQAEGADILRALSALKADAGGRDLDAEIEAAVAAIRATPAAGRRCAACGDLVSERDRFCPHCGAKLSA